MTDQLHDLWDTCEVILHNMTICEDLGILNYGAELKKTREKLP